MADEAKQNEVKKDEAKADTPQNANPITTPAAPVIQEEKKPEPADDDADDEPMSVADQLQMLKNRAELLGITYSNNIGVDALRAKIKKHLEGDKGSDDEADQDADEAPKETKIQLQNRLHKEANKLIRVRITNMDPKKADLAGEIFTTGNRYVGDITRFVPYNVGEDGWHIEQAIYDMLVEKEYQQVRVKKGPNGDRIPESRMVKEFAIEKLPPLTHDQLKVLANKQAAAEGLAIN